MVKKTTKKKKSKNKSQTQHDEDDFYRHYGDGSFKRNGGLELW